MNEIFIPILLIIGIGLILILANTLRHVNQVSRIIESDTTTFTRYPNARIYLKVSPYYIYIPTLLLVGYFVVRWQYNRYDNQKQKQLAYQALLAQYDSTKVMAGPDPLSIKNTDNAAQIEYGMDLIAHTADYLGPNGLVKAISNGMNCQNCHLNAGSKPFGNNFLAVASTYPKFRARSGTYETIYKRVNDCFQRSLNGQPLDSTSREMKAIEAYIKWLGQAVPTGKTPKGAGLIKLKYLDRAANPDSGRLVFINKCQSCHGENGEGLPMPEGNNKRYPPLWGDKSYNEAAGLYRISNFAGYVKANMPFGANYDNPLLTDAEAWDVAAFVNSQPRPKHPFLKTDWPKIDKKPFDHPFGPFTDSFPETQHKYGPYQPIVDWQKAHSK